MFQMTFAIIFGAAMAAGAQSAGNMPEGFYPQPACIRPDKKTINNAPGVQDQDAMLAYNLKLKAFNRKVETFNACMKAYDDKSLHDQQRILFIVNSAVADARGSAPPSPPQGDDGNLPNDFYPGPSCSKPAPVGAPPSPTDHKAMTRYNQLVATYNGQVTAFGDCIRAYTARAQNDLDAIVHTVQMAGSAQ